MNNVDAKVERVGNSVLGILSLFCAFVLAGAAWQFRPFEYRGLGETAAAALQGSWALKPLPFAIAMVIAFAFLIDGMVKFGRFVAASPSASTPPPPSVASTLYAATAVPVVPGPPPLGTAASSPPSALPGSSATPAVLAPGVMRLQFATTIAAEPSVVWDVLCAAEKPWFSASFKTPMRFDGRWDVEGHPLRTVTVADDSGVIGVVAVSRAPLALTLRWDGFVFNGVGSSARLEGYPFPLFESWILSPIAATTYVTAEVDTFAGFADEVKQTLPVTLANLKAMSEFRAGLAGQTS